MFFVTMYFQIQQSLKIIKIPEPDWFWSKYADDRYILLVSSVTANISAFIRKKQAISWSCGFEYKIYIEDTDEAWNWREQTILGLKRFLTVQFQLLIHQCMLLKNIFLKMKLAKFVNIYSVHMCQEAKGMGLIICKHFCTLYNQQNYNYSWNYICMFTSVLVVEAWISSWWCICFMRLSWRLSCLQAKHLLLNLKVCHSKFKFVHWFIKTQCISSLKIWQSNL